MRTRILPLLLIFALPARAEVYQWVDREGKTHFGDRAPQGQAAKIEKVDIKTAPARVDPEAEAARQQLRSIAEGRERERTYAAQKAAEQQQHAAQWAERCAALKRDIGEEQRAGVMFNYDEAGQRQVWTSEQRIAYRERLQNLNRQHCSSDEYQR